MSPSPEFQTLFVYVTHPDREEAKQLACLCLEKKLIGCANIFSPVASLYRWEGKICEDEEWVLILKTDERHYSQLEELIAANHPASCPCIMAIPIERGNAPFQQWLEQSLADSA